MYKIKQERMTDTKEQDRMGQNPLLRKILAVHKH